jgi:hypothetical protein
MDENFWQYLWVLSTCDAPAIRWDPDNDVVKMSDLAPDALLFLCDDLCSLTLVLSV